MTDFKLKPLIRRPSRGGETAESIFGPVEYSFDGEYDSDGFISEVQVDLPWGPAEVFTNIDDADSWAEDQILQRILSARDTTTGAMTDTRRIAVKPLEWEWPNEYGLVCRAVTPIGTYSVSDDEDRPSAMFCYLHLTDDGDCTRYAVKVADDYLEPEEAQAAAQADYERRILSALTPAPEAEDSQEVEK